MNKLVFTIASSFIISGCAQMAWYKPNAQQGEFEKVRYVCLQQSQQYQSGVGIVTPNSLTGGYTVIDTSGMETNSNLFNACMQANGWNLQKADQIQQNNQLPAASRATYVSPPPQPEAKYSPPPQYKGKKMAIDQAITQCDAEGIRKGTVSYGDCLRKYTQQ